MPTNQNCAQQSGAACVEVCGNGPVRVTVARKSMPLVRYGPSSASELGPPAILKPLMPARASTATPLRLAPIQVLGLNGLNDERNGRAGPNRTPPPADARAKESNP